MIEEVLMLSFSISIHSNVEAPIGVATCELVTS
jgi:hypothetical protein